MAERQGDGRERERSEKIKTGRKEGGGRERESGK